MSMKFLSLAETKAAGISDNDLQGRIRLEKSWNDLSRGKESTAEKRFSDERESVDMTLWHRLERDLMCAGTARGDEKIEKAQKVVDMARSFGAQDIVAEAALCVGSLRAEEQNLIRGVEIIQGILDLAQRRKRPELVLRAEVRLAEIFLSRGRKKPGQEFLRRASRTLSVILRKIPVSFRSYFLAKKEYRSIVDLSAFRGIQEQHDGENIVENVWKS
jgi:hypothetical protein